MPESGSRPTLGVRSGGRSARVRQAVIDATVEELLTVGHEEVSLARIAEAAGVARSTVDRRWPSRGALLADAVEQMAGEASAAMAVPDLGDTRAELRVLVGAIAAALAERRLQVSLHAMIAVSGAEMREIRARHWARREAVLRSVVARAIERGDVAVDADPLHLGEMLTAPIWMRTFATGQPVDEALLDRVVDDTLRAFAPR